jgi:hypothetical protein
VETCGDAIYGVSPAVYVSPGAVAFHDEMWARIGRVLGK